MKNNKKCPKEIKFCTKFINEINKFDTIYVEISGGYHSCTTALLFFELNFKNIVLLHNDTKLQYSECLENIHSIIRITDYPIIFKEPNLKKRSISEIMIESFKNIEKAKADMNNYRSYMKCCKFLKNTRNSKWNNDFLLENSIIISSICAFESYNRFYRLNELKCLDTFIRFHKSQNVYKAYPFRDLSYGNMKHSRILFNNLFEGILRKYNLNLVHSGCKICPIRILFPELLTYKDCSIKYNKIINKID